MEIHKVNTSENAFWGKKTTIYIVISLVLVATVVLLAATYKVIDTKRVKIVEQEQERLETYVQQRTQAFNRQVQSLAKEGDRLVESDLFRLYATEIEAVDGDLSALVGEPQTGVEPEDEELTELLTQLPFMQNMLREFAIYAGFISARVFNPQGKIYIETDLYLPPVSEEQKKLAIQTARNGKVTYSPLRKTELGLEFDFFLPIFPPEGGSEDEMSVGVLLMTRQITGALSTFLAKTPLSLVGESTHLVQEGDSGWYEVTPWSRAGITPIKGDVVSDLDGEMSFGQRASVSEGEGDVFSVGHRTVGNWLIVQEIDVATVMKPVDEFSRSLYAIAWLGVFAVTLVMSLAWWILAGLQSRKDAEILAQQAAVIEDQKQFINSINESIDDFIVLKDLKGKYLYVNEAFSEAVGREKGDLVGLDDVAVFGFGTATRLSDSDQKVVGTKEKVVVTEEVFLQSESYHFQISKFPYFDSSETCIGVVQVYRDITSIVALQEKARQLNEKTISALGATIEAVDPYLADHTKLMAHFADVMGTSMGYSESDQVELVMAAQLSQIGKAFIPKDILSKPGKLTEEEISIVESHVDHSCKILREIDVPESVLDMIGQMNERLDGSGYPKNLSGDAIIAPARLLSVLNVFCALVSPRSYRSALEAEEALEILDRTPHFYDQSVVKTLKQVSMEIEAKDILEG